MRKTGSGRPRLSPEARRVTSGISLTPAHRIALRQLAGKGGASNLVRKWIDEALKQQEGK